MFENAKLKRKDAVQYVFCLQQQKFKKEYGYLLTKEELENMAKTFTEALKSSEDLRNEFEKETAVKFDPSKDKFNFGFDAFIILEVFKPINSNRNFIIWS